MSIYNVAITTELLGVKQEFNLKVLYDYTKSQFDNWGKQTHLPIIKIGAIVCKKEEITKKLNSEQKKVLRSDILQHEISKNRDV